MGLIVSSKLKTFVWTMSHVYLLNPKESEDNLIMIIQDYLGNTLSLLLIYFSEETSKWSLQAYVKKKKKRKKKCDKVMMIVGLGKFLKKEYLTSIVACNQKFPSPFFPPPNLTFMTK